jgi:hypothetical protein
VINPEQVKPAAPVQPVTAGAPRQTGAPRVIVSVAQPGLTAISYAGLAAIGFSLAGVDPLSLRPTHAGSEIAMQWDGDEDAAFDADERLLFVADPRFSRWTNTMKSAPGIRPVGGRRDLRSKTISRNCVRRPKPYSSSAQNLIPREVFQWLR